MSIGLTKSQPQPFGTINSISVLGNIATLSLDPSKPLIPNGKEYLFKLLTIDDADYLIVRLQKPTLPTTT